MIQLVHLEGISRGHKTHLSISSDSWSNETFPVLAVPPALAICGSQYF